ncbi:AAA family ATPase [uncultured Alistipes sp.]|uniref:AAA family ATPase n=2 Tax=Bacteroidales TaxID=171549 RepID=UPI0025950630|nr:AAA family ATPase [uncultured Alistipes sp.]
MAKTIIEILQEQAEIADNFAAMAQRVAPEIPIMEFPEIPRWNPEIPIMRFPEIPKLKPILPEIARMPIYKPAYPASYTKDRSSSKVPQPKRIKSAKPNPYAGQYFRLQEFKIITRYKNLEDLYVDFRNTTSYCTFIGLNGSGKSNVIEAISAVFYSLYRLASLKSPKKTDHCPFDYRISYIHNERLVEIENGKTKDGKKITEDILPKNVIVNYSGEESRLWRQYYEPIYSKFCSKLTDESQRFEAPQMLYIDKSCWEIALLTLLYSESEDTKTFVNSLFGEVQSIAFEYNTNAFKHWEQNFAKVFIDELKRHDSYTVEEFRALVQSIDFIDSERTLFLLLYQATKHDDDCLISNINIEFENGSNVEGLSEGEKKLILAYAILHVLATETSLTMFDEPDSHVHIARKTELVELLNTENRYSIVSTHSPIFIEKMCDTNIRFLKNGHLENVEKLKHIIELSGGRVNYLDGAFILSSKHVVVVEGSSDINYIKRAIEIFSSQDSKYNCLKQLSYLPLGGADHTESFYNEVIVKALEPIERVLFIYDYDRNGKKGYKIVDKYKAKQPKINAIYYQPDYSGDTTDNDFFVEDLFPPTSYQSILDELRSISQYNVFKSRNRSTCDMIKSHINEHYADDAFKERYKGFQPLLDYLIEYFFPLPTEIKGIYSEKALLQGKSDDIIHIYESLKAEITTLGKSITIHPLKHYIVLRNKEAQNILSIEIQSKKVLVYINKKKGTLVDKDSLTLDVSNKGHLGNGDYKIEITSIDRIKPVIDFLNKEVFNNI